jgi:preprotein translocase subunit SecD
MSKNPLLWKFILIFAVVGLTALSAYPPEEKINLGLDLRGGAYILMQVETKSALKYELDLAGSRIGGNLDDEGLSYASILPTGPATLEVRGTDPGQRADVRAVLDRNVSQWDIQSRGGGDFSISIPPQLRAVVETSSVETTLTVLRKRIDSLGVSEPIVQKQGIAGDRILIQLPGVEDPERIKGIIRETDLLEWKAVSYPPTAGDPGTWIPPDTQEAVIAQFGGVLPDDTELFPERFPRPDGSTGEIWWPLKRVSTVVGNDLRNAFRSANEWQDPVVSFELTQDAGRRFEAATRENLGKKMAIVLGSPTQKEVISAPVIQGVIRDQGIIQGGFDINSAEDLALKLRSGAMPTDISIIEERTVGPSLGRDSIRAGLTAGLAGFAGVMLFMLVYYRRAGINAVVALTLNVLLVFGILGALPFLFSGVQATLTLPGIAGLILVVGMAVDSNVLIFERIREELRVGKTVRSAVEQGFGKALSTILDCNVTTLVAAFFLFSYGTGPIKGFAVTLTIGLLSSLFTAVFVSRQLFELALVRKGRAAESLSI